MIFNNIDFLTIDDFPETSSNLIQLSLQLKSSLEELKIFLLPNEKFNTSNASIILSDIKVHGILKDDFICKIKKTENGQPVKRLIYGTNVYEIEIEESFITLKSAISGYLFYDGKTIDVLSPFFLTPQKYFLYYIDFPQINIPVVPPNTEIDKLLEDLKIPLSFLKSVSLEEKNNIGQKFNAIIIAQGEVPIPSKNANINFKIDLNLKAGQTDVKGNIDFHEKSFAKNITKDTVICEKTKTIEGKNGINLLGEKQTIKSPVDKNLIIGENIFIEENKNSILYKATTDGIIKFENNKLSVLELLNIENDVNIETGNISSNTNIHIKGDVTCGFSVKSKKNIFIDHNIENNVVIICEGDLTILGAIKGNSKIYCKGNLKVTLIENAYLEVNGNILVKNYILNSTIKCLSNIDVLGKGIDINTKGCIIHSNIYFLKKLTITGIGSARTADSSLFAAYNFKAIELMKKVNTNIKDLNRLITNTVRSSSLNIRTPNYKDLLTQLPLARQKKEIEIRKRLSEMLKQQQKNLELTGKIAQKENSAQTSSSITIKNTIYPIVYIQFKDQKIKITEIQKKKKIIFNNKIKILDLTNEI